MDEKCRIFSIFPQTFFFDPLPAVFLLDVSIVLGNHLVLAHF
jgi:hypothetical protein